MSIKLEDFRLESYKERELIMMALMFYQSRRGEDIDVLKLREAFDALERRISNTQCMPGGCSICGDGDSYGEHD